MPQLRPADRRPRPQFATLLLCYPGPRRPDNQGDQGGVSGMITWAPIAKIAAFIGRMREQPKARLRITRPGQPGLPPMCQDSEDCQLGYSQNGNVGNLRQSQAVKNRCQTRWLRHRDTTGYKPVPHRTGSAGLCGGGCCAVAPLRATTGDQDKTTAGGGNRRRPRKRSLSGSLGSFTWVRASYPRLQLRRFPRSSGSSCR